MKNKKTLAVVVLVLSGILVLGGAWFKIMHWPGASILLITGLLGEFAGMFMLLFARKE